MCRPSGDHSGKTSVSPSGEEVSRVGVPPAGLMAKRLLALGSGGSPPRAEKTMRVPSGDHEGRG